MIKIQIKPLPNSPALESVTDARTRTELMKVNENVKSVKGQLSECQRAVQELQQSGGSSSKVIVTPEEPEQPETPDIDLGALNNLVVRAEDAANKAISSATNAGNSSTSAAQSATSAGASAGAAAESATKAETAATKAEEAAASIVGGFRGPIVMSVMGKMTIGPFAMSLWGADPNKTYTSTLYAQSIGSGTSGTGGKVEGAGCSCTGIRNTTNDSQKSDTGTISGAASFSLSSDEKWCAGTLIITE